MSPACRPEPHLTCESEGAEKLQESQSTLTARAQRPPAPRSGSHSHPEPSRTRSADPERQGASGRKQCRPNPNGCSRHREEGDPGQPGHGQRDRGPRTPPLWADGSRERRAAFLLFDPGGGTGGWKV